ncbi:unnamed protein product [Lactuca saligna]|uniref:WEB family protein n=1 Tax=Lactuca saligna TaxID=75948 RepID=A0AA36EGC1_LACSI|nr:unnamed protein product [Lactuca saligna]
MFGFQAKNRQNAAASPAPTSTDPSLPSTSSSAAAVGEIDTAAPFESVRAAVTLFVEASPKVDKPVIKKPRPNLEESVLGKEAQLHWILKEIDKHKEYVKTAEATKEKALRDLDKANKTLQELTNKLEAASESKHASIQETEAANIRAHELEQLKSTENQADDEARQETIKNERNQYKVAANELIATKQELNNLKRDFDTALEAKLAAVQRAAEAQHATQINRKKIKQLSKDVVDMSVTLERVKFASAKAEEDYANLMEGKETLLESKKNAKEDTDLKIQNLRKESEEDPGNIEKRLEETTGAINVLEEQLKEVRAVDMELLSNANSELDDAKKRLDETKEEEKSLRDLVESLKQEVEDVKRDIAVSREEEMKREQLQGELDKIELEVKDAITEKTKATNEVDELELKIREMLLEAEKARREEEEMKRQVENLWRDAQWSEVEVKEAESKLEVAEREVEEAKAAQELANDQIRKRSCTEELTDSKSDNMIMLSIQDFEALNKKSEEAIIEADTKVETIMAEVETIKENERGILEKLEKSMEEQKEIEEEISKAEKTAEVADAARQTVETELNKWREETKGS